MATLRELMNGGWACVVVVLLVGVGAAAAQTSRSDGITRAEKARAAGDFKAAIAILQPAVAAAPDRVDLQLMLAETLAWDKRFDEAESTYRHVLEAKPGTHAARLGLARVLLWEGRYSEARAEFDRAIESHPRDANAIEGRATAAYWSGDLRAAERGFEAALALDPSLTFSQRSVMEIRQHSAPEERLDATLVDDDQPFRLFRAAATASLSSDPLTRWSAIVGTYRAAAPIYGTAVQPFAGAANETLLPSLALTINADAAVLRYGDGTVKPVGGLTLNRSLPRHNRIFVRAERRELLATATGMHSHPYVTTYAAGWKLDGRWLAAAEAGTLRYFDSNRGRYAFAYVLAPLISRDALRLSAGVSGTLRDSLSSRFTFAAVSSIRDGNAFDYSYRGTYSPYWAPQHLHEARGIVVAEIPFRSTTLKLHIDGGIAHDRAIAFGPSSGAAPLPAAIYSFGFDRTSHPVHTDLTASIPLGNSYRAAIGFENSITTFYRAKTFHASLVRHR